MFVLRHRQVIVLFVMPTVRGWQDIKSLPSAGCGRVRHISNVRVPCESYVLTFIILTYNSLGSLELSGGSDYLGVEFKYRSLR